MHAVNYCMDICAPQRHILAMIVAYALALEAVKSNKILLQNVPKNNKRFKLTEITYDWRLKKKKNTANYFPGDV